MASVAPPAKPAKVKPGEKRTEAERALAMCRLIADGKSLRKAAEVEGLKHSDFLALVAADAALRKLYETSKEAGIEASISELEEGADQLMIDVRKRTTRNAGALVGAFGHKANAVKWRAEKQLPKKYGPRVDHTLSGPGGGPVEFTKIERTIVDPAKK